MPSKLNKWMTRPSQCNVCLPMPYPSSQSAAKLVAHPLGHARQRWTSILYLVNLPDQRNLPNSVGFVARVWSDPPRCHCFPFRVTISMSKSAVRLVKTIHQLETVRARSIKFSHDVSSWFISNLDEYSFDFHWTEHCNCWKSSLWTRLNRYEREQSRCIGFIASRV